MFSKFGSIKDFLGSHVQSVQYIIISGMGYDISYCAEIPQQPGNGRLPIHCPEEGPLPRLPGSGTCCRPSNLLRGIGTDFTALEVIDQEEIRSLWRFSRAFSYTPIILPFRCWIRSFLCPGHPCCRSTALLLPMLYLGYAIWDS